MTRNVISSDLPCCDMSVYGKVRESQIDFMQRPSSYGSWIYNYLCNRCLSPLMLINLDQGKVYNIM